MPLALVPTRATPGGALLLGDQGTPSYTLQGSPGTVAVTGSSVSMSYTPPGGTTYALQGSPGAVGVAGSSVSMVYLPPVVDDWRPTAPPSVRRLASETRKPRLSETTR